MSTLLAVLDLFLVVWSALSYAYSLVRAALRGKFLISRSEGLQAHRAVVKEVATGAQPTGPPSTLAIVVAETLDSAIETQRLVDLLIW